MSSKILAKDLMVTSSIAVMEHMPLDRLAKLFLKNKIGAVPVMNKTMKIIGMVTITHLFDSIYIVREMHARKSKWLACFKDRKSELTVKDIYSPKVVSCRPETPLEDIIELMFQKDFQPVLVTNKDLSKLHGIIGRHDIIEAMFNH